MKKLLVLVLVSNMAISATFVPSSTYRGYTCDELKEDYKGWNSALLDTILNNIPDFSNYNRYAVKKENPAKAEAKAHVEAIEKQAKKISCDLKAKIV